MNVRQPAIINFVTGTWNVVLVCEFFPIISLPQSTLLSNELWMSWVTSNNTDNIIILVLLIKPHSSPDRCNPYDIFATISSDVFFGEVKNF